MLHNYLVSAIPDIHWSLNASVVSNVAAARVAPGYSFNRHAVTLSTFNALIPCPYISRTTRWISLVACVKQFTTLKWKVQLVFLVHHSILRFMVSVHCSIWRLVFNALHVSSCCSLYSYVRYWNKPKDNLRHQVLSIYSQYRLPTFQKCRTEFPRAVVPPTCTSAPYWSGFLRSMYICNKQTHAYCVDWEKQFTHVICQRQVTISKVTLRLFIQYSKFIYNILPDLHAHSWKPDRHHGNPLFQPSVRIKKSPRCSTSFVSCTDTEIKLKNKLLGTEYLWTVFVTYLPSVCNYRYTPIRGVYHFKLLNVNGNQVHGFGIP